MFPSAIAPCQSHQAPHLPHHEWPFLGSWLSEKRNHTRCTLFCLASLPQSCISEIRPCYCMVACSDSSSFSIFYVVFNKRRWKIIRPFSRWWILRLFPVLNCCEYSCCETTLGLPTLQWKPKTSLLARARSHLCGVCGADFLASGVCASSFSRCTQSFKVGPKTAWGFGLSHILTSTLGRVGQK